METQWVVLCVLLIIPGLMVIALIGITIQNFRVRSWKETAGRIVVSKAVARAVHKKRFRAVQGQHISTDFITDETVQTLNFVDLSYTYAVSGINHQGTAIDLSTDPGNFDVVETLKRYPEGKAVTVIYDPDHPDKCILERDDPKKLRTAWFSALVMTLLCVGGVLGVDRAADILHGILDNPKRVPFVVAFGLFAIVLALFAHMAGRAKDEMRTWLKTDGRIVRSTVEATVQTHRRPNALADVTQTIYMPRVVYSYDVDGNTFEGDDVGSRVGGGTPDIAEKHLVRFPVDGQVSVFYNPKNPTQSTLVPNGGYLRIVLWALAALFAAASIATTNLVPGLIWH